ncbi:MAG: hypothetical protein ACE5JO_08280, partial [Candidatus Binatia bacterium]
MGWGIRGGSCPPPHPPPGGWGSDRGGKEGKGEAAKAEGCFVKGIIANGKKGQPAPLLVPTAPPLAFAGSERR